MSMRYQAAILTASYFPLKTPSAPTIGTATQASSTSVSVTFTAPTDIGGGAISSYVVVSSPGNIIASGTSSPIVVTGLTTNTAYSFRVFANNAFGNSPASASSNVITPTAIGQQAYTTAGTYSWVAPAGVTSVSVVCIGGGGGGGNSFYGRNGGSGGGLGYKNNITVVPGNSYTIVVGAAGTRGTVSVRDGGNGGNSTALGAVGNGGLGGTSTGTGIKAGGGFSGDGGGNGGAAIDLSCSGGGGAGGYAGNGGDGGQGSGSKTSGSAGATSSGAGGGGGGAQDAGSGAWAGAGGGVGILGLGSTGAGGAVGGSRGTRGGGGSGGTGDTQTEYGGAYGGGGGAGAGQPDGVGGGGDGGVGAVRIIWGAGRAFPSTNTGNL
jgi:hypothetical protein